MSFYCFEDFYSGSTNRARYPEFDQWLARRLTRIFESGKWVERATILLADRATLDWGGTTADGVALVPDSLALPMLVALENYIQWARADPRWKQQYQHRDYEPVEKYLVKLPGKIVTS